jgi:uncharacterized protein
MRIQYLDGVRLRRALVAGCDYVQRQRAELNRINVFPVPDGDTGTNLALTASAIADRLRASRARAVGDVSRQAADAAIMGARGNCGMILSHFLLGFSDAVRGRSRLTAAEFGAALHAAAEHVYRSLERPVEGTIITVMRDFAAAACDAAARDFAELIEVLLTTAKESLERTPDLLPQLKAAGVVDAGAKGFVHIVEGVVGFVHGDPFMALDRAPVFEEVAPVVANVEYPIENERYRFCTEALVRGDALPAGDELRRILRERGDSLIVVRGDDVLKVHIHTDEPDAVFGYLRGIGTLVTHKAEDMQAQHAAVERAAAAHIQLARRPFSLVTDSACDLPDEIVRAHGIHVVPLSLVYGDQVLRDRIDITADAFVERLRRGDRATTSQPPPAAFLEAFRRAAEDGETVLAVILGAALSGTFGSAEAAAKQLPELRIRLFDSAAASLTQGLLVLRAAELGELGKPIDAIVAELTRIRDQAGVFFTVDVFDNLLASGRVGRGQVMIAGLLDIKPILGIERSGRVVPIAKVRGARNVFGRMLELVAESVPADAGSVRFGIIHVGYPEIVAPVSAALRERFGDREIIAAPASPVLATHLGPKAWGLAWQRED